MKRFTIGLLVLAATLGLVPSAQAGGLPLENPACGSVIDHSFELSQPKFCNGTAFNVALKKGITIDLGGHGLLGNGTGSGVIVQKGGVTVRNGVVRRFAHGIDVTGSAADAVIQDLTVVDNTFGIGTNGPRSVIRRNVVVGSAFAGISASGKEGVVKGNHVVNNVRGIDVFGPDNAIKANHVGANDEMGISVENARARIVKNKVVGNGTSGSAHPGILMKAASKRAFVSRNTIVGNGDDGYRDDGQKNEATRNVAEGNGFFAKDGNGVGTGIDASAAVEPRGSGNRSLGNDASTQCVPAKLCKVVKGATELQELTPACGSTITQSFKLGANKTCSGHGFIVGKPGITIDLAGHTLRGDGGAEEYGIVNDPAVVGSGHDDVVVTNGVVRGFHDGVRMADVTGTAVTKVVAVDNEQFGVLFRGSAHTLSKSTVVGNDEVGVMAAAATDVSVISNRISNNQTGLHFNNFVDGTLIEANVLAGNHAEGATLLGDLNVVRSNRVLGNGVATGADGLRIDIGIGSDVLTNVIVGNAGTGYLDSSGAPEIVANTVSANGYDDGDGDAVGKGIDASGAPFPTGEDNIVLGNDSAMDQCDPDFLCA